MTALHPHIGISGLGWYAPPRIETAEEIARQTGIAVEVIRDKFGLIHKHRANADEHVSDMAVVAAQRALADAGRRMPGFEASRVGLVMYTGSEYKDHLLWSVANHVQHAIGATNAYAFELMALCSAGVIGLATAKAHLLADPFLEHALVVMASKEADLVDYRNPNTRFMTNFGDGAAAAVVSRGVGAPLLGHASITDGSLNRHVMVPRGSRLDHGHRAEQPSLQIVDFEGMKRRLDEVSLRNFVTVVDRALTSSGLGRRDLSYLCGVHMKRSMHRQLLKELGLRQDRAAYLDTYGHVEAADPLIGLGEAIAQGRLQSGQHVVLTAAGTGYTWAAICLRWEAGDATCRLP